MSGLTDSTREIRRTSFGSGAALLAAAVLLPFANGGHSIPAAAFLFPLFLLRFTRTARPAVGIGAAFALQSIAFAVQFHGMVPAPGVILILIDLTYGAAWALPYLADRTISSRLSGLPATLVFPCAWAAIDYLLSLSPYGSWGAAGYALYGNLPILQLLAVTGLWGISFLIGWVASAANSLWELGPASSQIRRVLLAVGSTLVAVTLGGGARLALFPPGAPTVRISSLTGMEIPLHPDPKVIGRFFRQQPLTPAEIGVIRARAGEIDGDLLSRAGAEARAGAKVVFWGEGNAPVMMQDQADLLRRGGEVAKTNGIYLGMALVGWHLDSTPPLENKLVLIGPDGKVAWESFKAQPVPGGESAISIRGDGRLRKLDTPYGRLTSIICFDADFPRLLAQAGRLEADIVLDPSNDWKAIDPWHTQMASFRAIEQGVNLVRQTSRGLSAAFDYEGRQLSSMDHYSASDRTLVSQVPTRGVRTPYSRFGDWFAWASIAGLAVLIIRSRTGVH